jgi:hypothetical protein
MCQAIWWLWPDTILVRVGWNVVNVIGGNCRDVGHDGRDRIWFSGLVGQTVRCLRVARCHLFHFAWWLRENSRLASDAWHDEFLLSAMIARREGILPILALGHAS